MEESCVMVCEKDAESRDSGKVYLADTIFNVHNPQFEIFVESYKGTVNTSQYKRRHSCTRTISFKTIDTTT